VLQSACKALRSWQEEAGTDVRMSVNLSAQEFARSDLTERVGEILDASGVEPAMVELEIRETMIVRDALERFSTCRSLKGLGVALALDDYGTGSSAIAQLAECPVETLKIDSSFVANIETSNQDRATCAAAISVAHSLGRKVIAEGVETEAQAAFLREKGCDFLQGFLVARPLAADEVIAYLASRAAAGDATRAS
jgi:EAL domain-containing protein (putative c-di-GMP-specific phosphodiesterase class I)